MALRRCRIVRFVHTFLVCCLFAVAVEAQTYSLSGKVADTAAHPVPSATVFAKSIATDKTYKSKTDANGDYAIPDLPLGDFEVWAIAGELQAPPVKVTLAAAQTTDLVVSPAPQKSGSTSQEQAPQSATSPSLSDLGFSEQQTHADTHLQQVLTKRTEMLKIHQRLGLITAIPMAAALITGPQAKAKGRRGETITEPTDVNLDVHAALGGLTTALYFTTASYAIFAPRIPNNPKHGGIRWHEALAFVHGSGMIVTPVLGYLAYKQENAGEKVHGIAAEHGAAAYVTAIAYGTSIIAVSWPIHLKFWERH